LILLWRRTSGRELSWSAERGRLRSRSRHWRRRPMRSEKPGQSYLLLQLPGLPMVSTLPEGEDGRSIGIIPS
jgi:hypothetical protein